MNSKNRLTVSILGRSYSLLTDERQEIVEKAAEIVDQMLKEMASTTTSPAELVKRTTFVALKMAVDTIKKDHELKAVYSKTNTLNELLKDDSLNC